MSRQQIWEWILFGVSVIYLVYELAFNSRIVDGASGEFSALKLEALELQGRILSGIGISLLALRFVKTNDVAFTKFASRALLTTLFAFGFMFLGQKFLLDSLVNASSEEARNDAMYVALLKSGVFNGNVQLDDINISDEDLDSASTRSMLAIMGAMLFNSSTFVEHLKAQADNMIDMLAEQDARKTLPAAYEGYQDFQQKTATAWKNYAKAVNEYNAAMSEIKVQASQQADEIYLKAANEYSKKVVTLSDAELITKSLEIKRSVSDYFEAKASIPQRCSRNIEACQIKLEDAYRDTVMKEAGRFVAPDYWCHAAKEVQKTERVRGRMRVVMETEQDCKSMSRNHIEDKLVSLLNGGPSFLDNSTVASSVASELKQEGVTLPANWSMHDREALIDALTNTMREEIDSKYREGIVEQTGTYIEPDLEQNEFIALPLIQDPIQEALDHYPAKPITISLSPDEFLTQIHKIKYREVYEEKRDVLMQDGEYFGDDEPMEIEGKNYYKSIIIPPFAMSFSLFFGLLNLAAFFRTLVSLKVKNTLLAHTLSTSGMVIAFFVIPMSLSSVTVDSKAFQYFKSQLAEDYPYILPDFAAWVINTQPVVYPLGHNLAKLVGQESIEAKLETYAHQPDPTVEVIEDADELFNADEYLIPGIDIPLADEAGELVTSDTNTEPMAEDMPNVTTFYRQNESNRKSHAYSRHLIKDTLSTGDGLMIDISPIEGPESEKWIAYDKPFYGNDICLPGRRKLDSLRDINDIQWRSGFHGPCLSNNANSEYRLPSIKSVIRSLAKRQDEQPIILSLQEDLTGEVFCRRYDKIAQQFFDKLGYDNITLSTPSIRILGCFNNAPSGVSIAFEMPMYSDSPNTLIAKGHQFFTRAEFRRIKSLSKGERPTLQRINTQDLKQLLDHHPYITTLLVDGPLLTKEVERTVSPYNVNILGMSGRILKGELP